MKKTLTYGIVGLIVGAVISGTVVASQMTAASKLATTNTTPSAMVPSNDSMEGMTHGSTTMDQMSMADMKTALEGKSGDDFDKAFIEGMIAHHQGAIEMAKAAEANAGHQEIKDLSKNIISAQESEISQMQQWQKDWGFTQ